MATKSKKRSTQKNTKTPPQTNRLWSIAVFALMLFFLALTFIKGQAGWSAVQNALFGLFGIVTYLLAPFTLYIAVLLATGQPYKAKLLEVFVVLLLLCGLCLVFSGYDSTVYTTFSDHVNALYTTGVAHSGGGVFAVPLGLSLLCWAGRPAANIILIILLIVFCMILTDITPVDIYAFLSGKAKAAKESASTAIAQRDERREERRSAQEQAKSSRRTIPQNVDEEPRRRTRRRFNIDVPLQNNNDDVVDTDHDVISEPELPSNRGSALSREDYENLSSVLKHDVLAAAGREALSPSPKKQPYINSIEEVPLHPTAKQPYDQDADPGPAVGSGIALNACIPDSIAAVTEEISDKIISPVAQSAGQAVDAVEASSSSSGEIDDLIQKALSGASAAAVANEAANVNPAAANPTEQSSTPVGVPPVAVLPVPYHLPSVELLDRQARSADQDGVNEEMKKNAQILVSTLESFGVKTKILDVCRGPSVTRYELQPLAGVKISRITNLADDIALNLASGGVRIEAPIPGKPAVGIEVPNKKSTPVALRSLIQSDEFKHASSPLTFCLGRDIAGNVKVADLTKMPHLLIAGSTGSGKSVCINSVIMSFLYKSSPDDVRLILIDPKVVELAEYNSIPHLLMPVVTEPRKAAGALGSAVAEMERRYQLFASNNVRDIKSYNELAKSRDDLEKIPYIAILIDELADLMMVAGKDVEDYICRIAQKARAAGMHLIVATQRPSVDVITGLIKANIPSRIAFAVSSQIDSRTILDGAGAEKLLGMGDMLFFPVGASKPTRIQGTYVKDAEIERVIEEIKSYADSRYDDKMIEETERRATADANGHTGTAGESEEDAQDPMLKSAIETVVDAGMASTSLLQRKLKLGYARAARIMDEMESLHIIGPYEGSKPRQVLISRNQYLEMSMNDTADSQSVPQ